MKKTIFVLSFIFFPILNFANNQLQADSLLRKLELLPDSLKANILSEISWELRNSAPEKSIKYGMQAIEYAQKYNDFESLVKAHSFVGVAYRILGNYSESTDYFYKGLELAKKYHVIDQEGYAYINIGNLHIYQEYYNSAMENLYKALDIAEKTDNKRIKAYVLLNLGRAQMLKKDYDNALINFEKALSLREEIKQISGLAVCYKYMGDVYFDKNNFPAALNKYKESLKTVDKQSDQDLTSNLYVKIAATYLISGNYSLAEENANHALEIAKNIGAKLVIRDAFDILSQVYFQTGRFKDAAQSKTCIIKYNDTLFNQQLSEKIFNLEYRFEKEKKQAEIDLLNKDKQINKLILTRTRILTFTLAVILLLISGILIYFIYSYRHRKRQNIILEQQKEELNKLNHTKDKMFLIIGHDLRGPVGSLISLIEILLSEEEISKNKSLVNTFNIFMKSVQSINDLMENLLFWAQNQGGEVVYVPEKLNVNLIIERNLLIFKGVADSKEIHINSTIIDEFNALADKNMITLVVRNLVSNAIKFTPVGGYVNIGVHKKNGFIKVDIEDTGIGFNKEILEKIFRKDSFFTTTGTNNERGSGLGLTLCQEFVTRMGGSIWAESKPGEGSIFSFTVPSAD
ncbi:MAG: hypothetical protein A2X13_05215 [Bacteroidetes bacterium GWC2_33_15]|nr:MAG: hypothetical protein A2X10_11860 [Bacteroidetes bacterium GWA2_33_15]OFX51866.1 MAG: hypothetical protein A2X13_05215 [Bacteroidetes bacterium GWC2_33_15]OFX63434.1 MAG: hypothetical protein A2X15_01490 [Bacteroidetes bacterium GWB2_32_14]OFX67218.1 MAG: hypothetical protein A2X14_01260 [Bacteroidetes bacterium GWD2_33_33]HAN17057.1 hypothetical protein [Bacteroidales bacterium]